MSEFQKSMSRLRDMIVESNNLVEIKKEDYKKGRKEGAIEQK